MSISKDLTSREVANSEENLKTIRMFVRVMGVGFPFDNKILNRTKMKLKTNEVHHWAALASQGQGVPWFVGDPVCNCWLYNYKLLRPSIFITALQMRSNTCGVKSVLYRGRPQVNADAVLCRRCRARPETCAHVLGYCSFGKPYRIKRHNEIVDLIISKINIRGGAIKVMKEPEVVINGAPLKPDLIVVEEEAVYVIDVTVRYENEQSLFEAKREKEEKYQSVANHLAGIFHRVASVAPVVVGSRGALPHFTVRTLERCGFVRADCVTTSLIALRTSMEMFHQFLDG
ncbi:uncharacterized protein LOC122503216 [Leptopilina heterotoma]|uniref:uncharacterized protein LOC122503216 n=1 Tax=Leptopilina heterotoma TaxID=63436 RepID=UPI001CA872A6|nr:uncharacterized protein LOC122503216 [Leptopilina heterotoma]